MLVLMKLQGAEIMMHNVKTPVCSCALHAFTICTMCTVHKIEARILKSEAGTGSQGDVSLLLFYVDACCERTPVQARNCSSSAVQHLSLFLSIPSSLSCSRQ